MDNDDEKPTGKAIGGTVRMSLLSPDQRKEQAKAAAAARWSGAIKKATHASDDHHPLKIGDVEISCYVLEDGTRVLSQRGLQAGIGLSEGGGKAGARRIPELLERLAEKDVNIRDLIARAESPIRFTTPRGGNASEGYDATILPDLCAVLIEAGQKNLLGARLKHLAPRAAMLQHGFATIGIISLVDEATGYQKDRAKDALAKILEAFIAKELQPWVKTFPAEFYEQMFRLRGLEFPTSSVKKPQYFGLLTNNIVYDRLAPGVLAELKRVTPRNDEGRPTAKYFQSLTANTGYSKLKEHIGAVTALMKISETWDGFMRLLDKHYTRYGDTIPLPLDDGKGL